MDRVWLKRYTPGVPHTIELGPGETLLSVFDESVAKFGDRPAYTNLGRTLSFNDTEQQSRRFAAWLQSLGLPTGERVAIMMPNLLQYPIALFGALRAGLVVVNVNPLYTAPELNHQLTDSGARVIVALNTCAATVQQALPGTAIEHVVLTEVGDMLDAPKRWVVNLAVRYLKKMVKPYSLPDAVSFRDTLATTAPYSEPELTGEDLAFLQYTGGTTGRAKGAMLKHSNLVANVRQCNVWFAVQEVPGPEIVITALPLYHVYALTCNCLSYLAKGGHNILITDPRDTKGMIAEMAKWKFTAITGVNTLYQALARHPDLPGVDMSNLCLVSAGGMAVLEDTANAWQEVTGTHILEGYGLSETSPVLTTNPVDLNRYSGSIGLPLPSTDIALRGPDGEDVPLGEIGEICASGPQVMKGYWQNEEATAASMTPDGYFMTGDLAIMDEEGFFRIVDRKKDMILVSGFNVYPNEVENAVNLHPDVLEAACIGVPDEDGEERVKVFVVKKPGSTLTEQELRKFCRESLTAYKVPKLVEFRDSLPKSNVGKVLRRELRDEG